MLEQSSIAKASSLLPSPLRTLDPRAEIRVSTIPVIDHRAATTGSRGAQCAAHHRMVFLTIEVTLASASPRVCIALFSC
ncbi:MAG: hypothetical protein ACM338_15720, partial [Betaproteobacteria bacterium]